MRGPAISTAAAVLVVGTLTLGGSSAFFPPTAMRINLNHGKATFNRHCASCHTVSEEGGSRRAPPLHRIGEVAGTRVSGQGPEQYILTSITRPDAFLVEGATGVMPANIAAGLSRAELIDLVAYLSTLGGEFRPGTLVGLDWELPEGMEAGRGTLRLDSIERGRQLFLGEGNCSTCHDLRKDIFGNDLMAPSLARAGRLSREDLEQALLDPSRHLVEGYETWMVAVDGVVHSGLKASGRDGKIRLVAVDEQGGPELLEFDPEELEELDDEGRTMVPVEASRMPPVGEVLEPGEIEALLDFLMTLR
ncbi:c-type cytochrome [Tautonia plasticadhaerens]|uniref:Cytochrome c n=1 Tax=Tautonia plasticadhaerens TaxID=2527974 RepID=A0A518H311_9BACT|nr:c-type cytochrome [Tautonia plasticadhaerens]QDV35207.1 Cytochrome c [Tautonia plasticadhaerens]